MVQCVSKGVWSVAPPVARGSWSPQMITLLIWWNQICSSAKTEDTNVAVQGDRSRGRRYAGPWVSGNKQKFECLFFYAPQRDRNTLISINERERESGSLIHSDEWPVFGNMCARGRRASRKLYWSRYRRKHRSGPALPEEHGRRWRCAVWFTPWPLWWKMMRKQ